MTEQTQTTASDDVKVAEQPASLIEKPKVDGIVYYTDGGVRPTNPGPAGYGFHGYTYQLEEPKKGSGCPNYNLTADGYVEKAKSKAGQVKPLQYIDGSGAIPDLVTNNVAEITAATWALTNSGNFETKKVVVLTDSEMVVKGVTQFVAKWMNNGWVKADGAPVANQDYWKQLHYSVKDLEKAGVEVIFKWIKGHNGHIGNEKSDFLATLGVSHAKQSKYINSVKYTAAEGYWNMTVNKSAFFTLRSAYFISNSAINKPGVYYIGNHGKDDDLLGHRQSDGAFAVIEIAPEPAIEIVKAHVFSHAQDLESVIYIKLDRLFSPKIYHTVLEHGDMVLERPADKLDRLDFNHISKEPITREYRPPRLSIRAIEALNMLQGVLTTYRSGTHPYCVTNVTNLFYGEDEKAKKDKTKLKDEINSQTVKVRTKVGFGFAGEYKPDEASSSPLSTEIELNLGLDVPDRNSLKKLEKCSPQVLTLTWMESPSMFRHATVVTSTEGVGIFAAVYSNIKYVTPLAA